MGEDEKHATVARVVKNAENVIRSLFAILWSKKKGVAAFLGPVWRNVRARGKDFRMGEFRMGEIVSLARSALPLGGGGFN